MAETVIGKLPPNDGRDWEPQCARCGSSVGYDEVDTIDLGHLRWRFCLSSEEWCRANPLPGREDVKRGTIEWFKVEIRTVRDA